MRNIPLEYPYHRPLFGVAGLPEYTTAALVRVKRNDPAQRTESVSITAPGPTKAIAPTQQPS